MSWTEQDVKTAAAMWQGKQSAGTIAEKLNKTRSAVMAKITRLGIKGGSTPSPVRYSQKDLADLRLLWEKGTPRQTIADRLGRTIGSITTTAINMGLTARSTGGGNHYIPVVRKTKPTTFKIPEISIPEPVSMNLELVDLEHDQCRFSTGHDDRRGHLFCGHPVKGNKSWCPYHCERVFQKREVVK